MLAVFDDLCSSVETLWQIHADIGPDSLGSRINIILTRIQLRSLTNANSDTTYTQNVQKSYGEEILFCPSKNVKPLLISLMKIKHTKTLRSDFEPELLNLIRNWQVNSIPDPAN